VFSSPISNRPPIIKHSTPTSSPESSTPTGSPFPQSSPHLYIYICDYANRKKKTVYKEMSKEPRNMTHDLGLNSEEPLEDKINKSKVKVVPVLFFYLSTTP
jgi:hypothetical protein